MAHVYVLNGPNLNRLGTREPGIYGTATMEDLASECQSAAESLGLTVTVLQTNDESELIGWLHRAQDEGAAVVLNPAAFTHYSYALRDACAMVTSPLVEVHLSNPAAREEFRHTSVIAGVATGTIAGFGVDSYRLALRAVAGPARGLTRCPFPSSGIASAASDCVRLSWLTIRALTLLVTDLPNVRYLSGFSGSNAVLVIGPGCG